MNCGGVAGDGVGCGAGSVAWDTVAGILVGGTGVGGSCVGCGAGSVAWDTVAGIDEVADGAKVTNTRVYVGLRVGVAGGLAVGLGVGVNVNVAVGIGVPVAVGNTTSSVK